MRGATLFSGGGGAEALLRSHINFVHAVEYDAHIAAVYAANIGPHVQVARVEDVDYSLWGALDYLHASPVCKEEAPPSRQGWGGSGWAAGDDCASAGWCAGGLCLAFC